MYNANFLGIFFCLFPPLSSGDNICFPIHGEVSRVKHPMTVPPTSRHLFCLSLTVLPVGWSQQDPNDLSKYNAPVHSALWQRQQLFCPAFTERPLTLLFPGGKQVRAWDCPRPVGTQKNGECCLHKSFIGNSLNTWSTPETFQNNTLEEPSPPPKVSVNQQLHRYCP